MALSLACHGLEIPTDTVTFAKCNTHISWDKSTSCLENLESTGRKVPIIVHNGYMDLMFLLTHFHSHKLPPTFTEAKSIIHSYFPIIYDTKFLSTECTPSSLWNESTQLEALFNKLIRDRNERIVEVVSETAGLNGFSYLLGDEGQAHDAGYDAFMTGAVYIRVCQIIQSNQELLHGPSNMEVVSDGVGSLSHLLCDEKNTKSIFGCNRVCLQLATPRKMLSLNCVTF